MYVITNREISNEPGLKAFGEKLNSKGPHELRLLNVSRKKDNSWNVKLFSDALSKTKIKSLNAKYNLSIDVDEPWFGSLELACNLFSKAQKERKSILIFVHGFNNDIEDVLIAADEIEKLYNVIVVPFTWPANGGGAVSGLMSYKSDKSDARASTGALNRVFGKVQTLHRLLTVERKKELQRRARNKYPNNQVEAHAYFSQLMEKDCPVTLNLLCHSMGNYLLKHTLKTSETTASELIFDNINLVAADTNNAQHARWIGKLDCRMRVNIIINENDAALKASRIKPGEEQLARLGHYIRDLNSSNACYIDVTHTPHVGGEHVYFMGAPVQANSTLKKLFTDAFNGRAVEQDLSYKPDNNSYQL